MRSDELGKERMGYSAVSNGNASSPIFGRMDLFIDLMTVSHALHNDASHFTPLGLIAEKFSCKTH